MKKNNNETWLGFFKKTLKVSALIILIVIGVVVAVISYGVYSKSDNDGKTYLNCEDQYLAFNRLIIYYNWDGLEKKWNIKLDVTKYNKSIVEAKINLSDGKGVFAIDRIKGTWEVKSITKDVVLTKENCKVIKKSDLPKSKVTPKF